MVGIGKKKTWTALAIIPPLIFLIAIGPPAALHVMVLVATLLGLREFFQLALPPAKGIERNVGITVGLLLSLLISQGELTFVLPALVLALLLISFLFMIRSKDLSATTSHIGITFYGIFYIGFLLSHVSLVRNMNDGTVRVLLLILTVWTGDIFAYLCGSLLGRYKLYPKVSPKKTVEGLLGAVLGAILMSLLFSTLFIPTLGKGTSVLLGIGSGLFGQLGDLTESMLKRSAQVKDSGSFIPGHGGMLDRVDSFLFSAPFFYYTLLGLLKEIP